MARISVKVWSFIPTNPEARVVKVDSAEEMIKNYINGIPSEFYKLTHCREVMLGLIRPFYLLKRAGLSIELRFSIGLETTPRYSEKYLKIWSQRSRYLFSNTASGFNLVKYDGVIYITGSINRRISLESLSTAVLTIERIDVFNTIVSSEELERDRTGEGLSFVANVANSIINNLDPNVPYLSNISRVQTGLHLFLDSYGCITSLLYSSGPSETFLKNIDDSNIRVLLMFVPNVDKIVYLDEELSSRIKIVKNTGIDVCRHEYPRLDIPSDLLEEK